MPVSSIGEGDNTASRSRVAPIHGVIVCRVRGFADAMPVLTSDTFEGLLVATGMLCELSDGDIDAEVAVMFESGIPARPIVVGRLLRATDSQDHSIPNHLHLSARRELVLTCGKTTVKMLDDGTVAIRGENVATRATHTNRIRGGNVQIN